VSEIPKNWVITTFEEICTKISDGTHHSPKVQHAEPGPGRFKYVTSKNVRPWGMDLEGVTYVDESIHREIYARCNPEIGDVLLTKDGVNTGVVAINSLREEFSLLSSVALLKIKPALVDARFLKHYISSPSGNRALLGSMTGTAIRRIILREIKEAPIPVPPLAEQKRIVAKIEELFSELEAGEESLRVARRQLGVYRQSLLKQAFEGKLSGGRSGQRTRPQQWRNLQLKEACENIKVGIVIQPKQYYSKDQTGIKAFRSANVREFRVEDANWVYFSEAGNEANKRTQLKADDVLIVRSGHPGTSCVVTPAFEGCNAIDILVATPDQRILHSDYLCAFNNSPLAKGLFSEGSRGVAQKHLNVGVYSALTIPTPPLPEQQEIVRLLDEQFEVIERNEREIDGALGKSEALRQAILKRAFTGRLVSQDPTDEPASTLLARLRTESPCLRSSTS
jgi:type I restriction enzyme S subunit